MKLGLLTLSLHLEGCRSLKEKRQRIRGLKDRFGRMQQVAVCESGDADRHDKSQWSFVCIAQHKTEVERTLIAIEQRVASEIDAVIYQRQLEFL